MLQTESRSDPGNLRPLPNFLCRGYRLPRSIQPASWHFPPFSPVTHTPADLPTCFCQSAARRGERDAKAKHEAKYSVVKTVSDSRLPLTVLMLVLGKRG